jgi:hypothetical protein
MRKTVFLLLTLVSCSAVAQPRNPQSKAIYLEDISWPTAQKLLTPEAFVVIPLGANSKEHGPHLPLATDYLQAEAYAINSQFLRNECVPNISQCIAIVS